MSLSSALPVLVFLLAVTQASPSWTTGNTTANPPFQISAKAFTTSIHKYNAGIAGLIPGYDTSLPPSNTTPPHTNSSSSSGQSRYWYLKAVLAVNAPLSDSSAPAQEVDKQKFTQLTAIGLDSNANTTIDEAGWRVCATVFTGGVAGSRDVGFNPSPSCDRWLSKECQRAMRESAGKSPLGGDGKCRGIDLPAECGAVGGGGGEQVTTQITTDTLGDGYFFAYGTSPTNKGDNVSIAEAADRIWPVVMNWVHLAEDGRVQSSDAGLSCMSNIGYRYVSTGVSDRSLGARSGLGLALIVAVVGAVLLA